MKIKNLIIVFVLMSCSSDDQGSKESPSKESLNTDGVAQVEASKKESSQVQDSTGGVESQKTTDSQPVEECDFDQNTMPYPDSIQNFITLLNSLPKPTSVICVVNALPRPFSVNATANKFSAQGATSYQSPRIFIKLKKLVISVVPDGGNSDAIELAEVYGDGSLSVKGDLKFPLEKSLNPTDPFQGLYQKGEALCGNLCHSKVEIKKTWEDGVIEYASSVIFPREVDEVPLIDLEMFRDACEAEDVKDKKLCRFYRALFDKGDISYFYYGR